MSRLFSLLPRWLLVAVLLVSPAPPAWAQLSDGLTGPDDRSPYSAATLVSEGASIQPGVPFTLALRLDMDPHWHSYWENPGDSGQPTSLTWALPEGFTAAPFQWPYPKRIDLGPLTTYAYEDVVHLLVEVTPPADLAPGTSVELAGEAVWLICEEVCLPAREAVALTLPVRTEAPAPSPSAPALAEARADLPTTVSDWTVRATRNGRTFALYATSASGRQLDPEGLQFFAATRSTIDHAAPQPVTREGNAYLVALQESDYAASPAERLRGTLVAPAGETWDDAGRYRALAVDVPVEDAQAAGLEAAGGADASGPPSLVWTLLLAFAGGLILNLMPCVFPILSIKILSFAGQQGASAATLRRHGGVFGAGVIVSFWVLAGLLLALRAGGDQIGWGFQLQSPPFIALMALLFFGLGLSLLGVFEIGLGLMQKAGQLERTAQQGEASLTGSFFSGVLATVVATPCTAPFMGAALGVALTMPAWQSLVVFTALGAGMAAPYVLLSMAPRLIDRLPRPGPWMETLKQGLAFPMFATTVWLVWVFGQQAGIDGVAFLLLACLVLGVAGWTLGRWNPVRTGGRVLVPRTAAAVGLVGAVALGLMGAQASPATSMASASAGADVWQPWSQERVEALRAEGRPVFIDFTAAWCLTCQVNKRTTLRTETIQDAFADRNVALLEADWTNEDPAITTALESFGRSGVPLYVLYPGDGSDPVLLPEILTTSIVLNALDRLPNPSTVASATP
ncbi:MAG: thioredoxin family protein [Bacteroidota bacterium]